MLTDHDSSLWATYVQAVRPLPGRAIPRAPAVAPPAPVIPTLVATPAKVPRRAAPLAQLLTGVQPAGLDNASWARFRDGRLAPVRTLDLHGKTVHAAHAALEHFLYQAHAERIRCVEIITGRGSGELGGAIRRELPHWLSQPGIRPLVLATAHPHARNEGATRVLLRRRRT
jgi:DNA-nicking Smr family endonuclease